MNPEKRVALERLYSLIARLRSLPSQGLPLAAYRGRGSWPARGVYFFFEPGEARSGDASRSRVVRVGTHAVSANSKSTLWGRLRQHRGSGNGGGNHRGSIFRRHVGMAMLGELRSEFPHWGVRSSATREIRVAEYTHEQRVSVHIGAMSVVWVAVPDAPSKASDRGVIERGAIALLASVGRDVDPPSKDWLGLRSDEPRIRKLGLWNLNHVEDAVDVAFLDVMERAVREMEAVTNGVRGADSDR